MFALALDMRRINVTSTRDQNINPLAGIRSSMIAGKRMVCAGRSPKVTFRRERKVRSALWAPRQWN